MKLTLSLALAASIFLSGCSVFQRSPTWDLVVRGNTSGRVEEGKGCYINHLHQLLTGAGVEHKIVAYQYHSLNAYREESIQAGVLIIYRDDTTPHNPWWITDEYRHVPVWVPNRQVEEQIGFFIQQRAEIISVKEYAASAPSGKQIGRSSGNTDRAFADKVDRTFAETRPGRAYRTLFAGQAPRLSVTKTKKTAPGPRRSTAPLTATTTSGSAAQAAQAFRSTHGTTFDPLSSVDREKMNELRRRLLSRNQIVRLRTE